ncbi:hypothetical protein [Pseudarthrobacter sp. S9]|uniref:hypothetical protein n=1 Tax=Pseudarthrobacter sp. S9 TaxID=3418421 RepID=UPI003D0368BE
MTQDIAATLRTHIPNVDIQMDYDYATVCRLWCDATECDYATDGVIGEARMFELFAAHLAAVLAPLLAAAKAEALREAAAAFHETRPNGQAYNGYRVAQILNASATDPAGRALVQAIHDRKAQR